MSRELENAIKWCEKRASGASEKTSHARYATEAFMSEAEWGAYAATADYLRSVLRRQKQQKQKGKK